jgi:ABC-type uncharacterized transport system substrate-binding protein
MKSEYPGTGPVLWLISVFCLLLTAVPLSADANDAVLIIRIEGKDFLQAVSGVKGELEEELDIHELVVSKTSSEKEIARKMATVSPKLVILMDNVSIVLYRNYQNSLPDPSRVPPSVSLMASFTDLAIQDLKNASGIFYEAPLVTSLVGLRAILASHSFEKVGTVYRPFMADSVRRNRTYCEKEGIELAAVEIPDEAYPESELKKALRLLLRDKSVSAFWLPNDSGIINPELFRSVWIPFAQEFRQPIIVGIEMLAEPRLDFGTFAVVPDHFELGVQAAHMVFKAMDRGWKVQAGKVFPPRSVRKIINLKQAESLFRVDKEKLQYMADKILE